MVCSSDENTTLGIFNTRKFLQTKIFLIVNYTQHMPYNCRAGAFACVGSQRSQLSLVLQILNPQNSITLQPQAAQTSVLLQVLNMREPYIQDSNHIGHVFWHLYNASWAVGYLCSEGRGHHWGRECGTACVPCIVSSKTPWSSFNTKNGENVPRTSTLLTNPSHQYQTLSTWCNQLTRLSILYLCCSY